MRRTWLLLASAVHAAPAAACAAGELGVSTSASALCLRASDGTLSTLTDVATGAATSSDTDLFTLFLSLPAAQYAPAPRATLSSRECANASVAAAGGGCLRLAYSGCGAGAPAAVTATVCANASAQTLDWRLAVTGVPPGVALASASFPQFALSRVNGGGGGAGTLLSSASDSTLFAAAPGASLSAMYPGGACAQLVAWYDAAAGVLLYTRDAEANVKLLSTYADAGGGFSVINTRLYPPGELAGVGWAPPYAVAMSTFTGDWRDAADVYAEWALTAWWSATPLRARSDIPAALLRGGAGIVDGIQNATGFRPDVYGPALEQLPAAAAALKAALGAPSLLVGTYGWERDGTWAGIRYLPPVPSAAAWQATYAALRAQGDEALTLVSGYWWVVARNTTRQGPAFNNSALVPPLADSLLVNASGAPFTVDAYDAPYGPADWRGLSHKLCHGASASGDALVPSFTGLVDLGAALLSFDQEIGGGQTESPCYHAPTPAHAHAPGVGPWAFTGFRDTAARVSAHAAARGAPLGLLTEQACETLIPSMASAYSRQFAAFWWPWGAVNGASPGLFSYLYHHLLPVLAAEFSQGVGDGEPDYHVLRLAYANALTRGLQPFYGAWQVQAAAAPGTLQANLTRAAAAYAPVAARWLPFFVYGRTAAPPRRAASPPVASWVTHAAARESVSLPSVVAGAFARAPGDEASPDALAVFVSIVDGATTLTLDLAGSGWRGGATTLFDGATGAVLRAWPAPPGATNISIDEPCGVRVVVVENATLPRNAHRAAARRQRAAAVTAPAPLPAAVDVFRKGEAGYCCIKIPSLTLLAGGALLATGEGRVGSCSDYAPTDIVAKRSADGGRTWSPLALVAGEAARGGGATTGNAAPVQLRGPGGALLLPFCVNNSAVWLTRSVDGGASWTPPVPVPAGALPGWTWVGTGPPASLQLASGRVVVPAYHSTTPDDDGDFSAAHVLLSDDAGASWRLGGGWDVPPQFANENQAVELADGRLWAHARGLFAQRLAATSADGGESWAGAGVIDGLEQPLAGCEGSTVLHAGAGALFYAGLAETTPLRFNLTLSSLPAAAANLSAGWRPRLVVDAGAAAYSALAVLAQPPAPAAADLGLLYERSNTTRIVFEPDAITFQRIPLDALLP